MRSSARSMVLTGRGEEDHDVAHLARDAEPQQVAIEGQRAIQVAHLEDDVSDLERLQHRTPMLAQPGSGRPSLARQAGHGANPCGMEAFRHCDLLLARSLVRVLRVGAAAVRVPRAIAELQAAVVAVSGIDRPVAAGSLALGEVVPDRVAGVGDSRAGRGGRAGADVATGYRVASIGAETGVGSGPDTRCLARGNRARS